MVVHMPVLMGWIWIYRWAIQRARSSTLTMYGKINLCTVLALYYRNAVNPDSPMDWRNPIVGL